MRKYTLTAAFAGLWLLSANAHFIFLEMPPGLDGEVRMRFAEEPLEPTSLELQERSAPMNVSTPSGESIEFVPGDEFRRGQVAAEVGVVTGLLDYGILERGGASFMLKYHAKAARSPKDAASKSDLPVDVVAEIAESTLTVTVLLNGKPIEGSELVVNLPNATEQAKATTGADGKATFPIEPGGWVGIRALVAEEVGGTHDGKEYTVRRNYSTLTFPYIQP